MGNVEACLGSGDNIDVSERELSPELENVRLRMEVDQLQSERKEMVATLTTYREQNNQLRDMLKEAKRLSASFPATPLGPAMQAVAPPAVKQSAMTAWVRYHDVGINRHYFYNVASGACEWVLPPGQVAYCPETKSHMTGGPVVPPKPHTIIDEDDAEEDELGVSFMELMARRDAARRGASSRALAGGESVKRGAVRHKSMGALPRGLAPAAAASAIDGEGEMLLEDSGDETDTAKAENGPDTGAGEPTPTPAAALTATWSGPEKDSVLVAELQDKLRQRQERNANAERERRREERHQRRISNQY